ncbi:hydrophobin [Pyrrhoderma noxium]|uniref:Hydrophobin n=1 Tax=Pyrrhoderma noxium TaxID=2282107 RepID=A0A286UFK3_9AGAM|nr:hydrophobin [Pyrrhoderma noxium]
MFSKFIVAVAFAVLAVATEPASQCNTGPVQCCDSVQSAGSPAAATELGLLGIVLQDLNIPVGLTCDPISVIGVGGDSCSANPVCCENNNFNGVCFDLDCSTVCKGQGTPKM